MRFLLLEAEAGPGSPLPNTPGTSSSVATTTACVCDVAVALSFAIITTSVVRSSLAGIEMFSCMHLEQRASLPCVRRLSCLTENGPFLPQAAQDGSFDAGTSCPFFKSSRGDGDMVEAFSFSTWLVLTMSLEIASA